MRLRIEMLNRDLALAGFPLREGQFIADEQPIDDDRVMVTVDLGAARDVDAAQAQFLATSPAVIGYDIAEVAEVLIGANGRLCYDGFTERWTLTDGDRQVGGGGRASTLGRARAQAVRVMLAQGRIDAARARLVVVEDRAGRRTAVAIVDGIPALAVGGLERLCDARAQAFHAAVAMRGPLDVLAYDGDEDALLDHPADALEGGQEVWRWPTTS